jgi:hypothetical protein
MAKTLSQIPPGGAVIGNESFVAIRPSGSESDDEDVLLDMEDVVQHILNQDSSIGGGGDASSITFTPADNDNWEGSDDPGNVDDALDELAARVKQVETSGGGGSVDAADVTFTPSDTDDWDGSDDPGDVNDALDELASRVKNVEINGGGGGGGGGDMSHVVSYTVTGAAVTTCGDVPFR